MKKHFTDKRTGIGYALQGDYYLPDLELPNEEHENIGVWGMRHKRFLKENHRILYADLMTSGKLTMTTLKNINVNKQEDILQHLKNNSPKENNAPKTVLQDIEDNLPNM